jgi:hypothetical protein
VVAVRHSVPFEWPAYLSRNREIVATCEALIGVSATELLSSSGSTWCTIRHAGRRGVPAWVVWPNGEVVPWP